MSSLPPPTGRPATMFPRPDPWAEQARRQERHREERRRRRRKWLIPSLVLVVVAGVIGGFFANEALIERRTPAPVTATEPAPSTSLDTGGPEPTIPPDQLVEVDRVWLIDRGDGVFDWGVSVRTPTAASKRSGVVIDVRLIDAADRVVERANGEVNGIGPASIGTVAGRLSDAGEVPVRLEFDVAVGVATNDRALGDLLDVQALERVSDSVRGRIRSVVDDSVEDVTMVLLWLDDEGEVLAAVPQPVEQVRPDVDARFEIDLGEEVVPDGRPDSVVWTR